jgi:RNA polymerase sigma-70 factor (ECF subfamily)
LEAELDPAPDLEFREAALACLDSLYGFALTLCRDRARAEDLVQETYVRALRARRKAEPGQGLRSWLFAILHNVWRNELRRPHVADGGGDLDRLPAEDGDPLQLVDRSQNGNRLRAAIDALPDVFRDVIVLRCVEGCSYREMAEIVGCPAGTIMSRLARGRALLKRALGPVAIPAAKAGER